MSIFSRKNNGLIGIDISSTSIKMVDIQYNKGLYHLKTYGVTALEPGQVVDKDIVDSEAVGEEIALLAQRIGVNKKNAATAAAGSSVITRLIDMDAALNDSEREAQIRLDADQYIPFPLSDVNLDFEIVGPAIADPAQVQVLLAASRSENVEQRVDALAFGGFDTKVVDIEAHAIERAFDLYSDTLAAQQTVIALFDIGHTQTTLYIVKNGVFVYNREQLFGGSQLTEAIQSYYNFSFEEAAQYKQTQSLLDDEMNDYEDVVLAPFVDALAQHISRSLQFYFSSSEYVDIDQYVDIDHIVLCGGSAALPNLTASIEKSLSIPTTIANPFINMSIDANINREQLMRDAPALMAACGLALRSDD